MCQIILESIVMTLLDTVIDWVRVVSQKKGLDFLTRGRDTVQTRTTDVPFRWSGKVVKSQKLGKQNQKRKK